MHAGYNIYESELSCATDLEHEQCLCIHDYVAGFDARRIGELCHWKVYVSGSTGHKLERACPGVLVCVPLDLLHLREETHATT